MTLELFRSFIQKSPELAPLALITREANRVQTEQHLGTESKILKSLPGIHIERIICRQLYTAVSVPLSMQKGNLRLARIILWLVNERRKT